MAAACLEAVISYALLSLLAFGALQAQESNPTAVATNGITATADLATRASDENLPQVSAAVLRSQIQQEQDAGKRAKLTCRLVILLVSGGRYDEALAVSSTMDARQDPLLNYWKGLALLGTGDNAAAKEIFSSLLQTKTSLPGISPDQIALSLARALRGGNDSAAALQVLDQIPIVRLDAPSLQNFTLEKGADLLALGRAEECQKLLASFTPTDEEGKAAATYLRAMAAWRSGNLDGARKLFASIPPSASWYGSAATLGEALCLSSPATQGKSQQGIELLEKHLGTLDEAPLLAEEFRLLDQLYTADGTPDTTLLKKWAEDASKPSRARLAAFYRAKGQLRLHHAEEAETLLDSFIKKYGDDFLADEARVLISSSRLQRGLTADAMGWASDRPKASSHLRARLAYLRGLAAASLGKEEEAKGDFQAAASLDPDLAQNALFNKTVLIATTDKGSLDTSEAARSMVALQDGLPSEEMEFQIALDLARRGQASGMSLLGEVAEKSPDLSLKSRARLAVAEWKMKSGKGESAIQDLAKAVHENPGEPEREEYLNVFLKDTGKKSDAPGVIASAKAFLKAHPDSRFVSEVRLKLAEALLASGDVQGARVEFEQLALSGAGTDEGRRALFLAAQSAARAMDPASIDDSLMLLERVAENGSADQLVWQARLQQGALKNAQNLPLEALAIYDKILSSNGPDIALRAATLMAKADTLHQMGAKDPAQDREAIKAWQQLISDPSMPLRWRNQALCKSGLVLENLGEGDAALALYYQAFKNPQTSEPEQLWHNKAAFEAARLLESRKQWSDAVTLYNEIAAEGGPRAEEAKARIAKLRLENFLWEN